MGMEDASRNTCVPLIAKHPNMTLEDDNELLGPRVLGATALVDFLPDFRKSRLAVLGVVS